MSYLGSPVPFPGIARGTFSMAGYGGSGEYTGPDWPRVTHHGDGTATLAWNELQSVRAPLVSMPEPGPDETFPELMPGIAAHPPGAIIQHRTLYVPAADGSPVAWYLHPNAPDGIILTPDGWRQYVDEGMLSPAWAPDAGAGPAPRDPDWTRGFRTVIPTTGEAGPRYDYRGSWELGPWFREEETAAGWEWVEIDPAERPFEGGPPCYPFLYGTLVQMPCEPTPDGHLWAPGEGPYAGRTPPDSYFPFLDPSSPWYGHPVVRMPGAEFYGNPPDPNVPAPCPEGYTRDPEDLSSECFPVPGEDPGDEPMECPEGWTLTPEGNCVRFHDPGDPSSPDPDEPVPCVDVSTGIVGTMDPETGECVPTGPPPGSGGNGTHPGAGMGSAGALALGAGLLLLLGGDR